MKSTIIFLLLVPVCWAKPFQTGLFDFMLEDEASGVGPTDSSFDPRYDLEPLGPVCPFRCQCHLRVVQCSDLGKFIQNTSILNTILSFQYPIIEIQH
uniref:LRRNT domain-containing protein n=1 Tax=Sarcophilus harrisii TaxID=9305 RepID=A0A7N4PLX0_SARHA